MVTRPSGPPTIHAAAPICAAAITWIGPRALARAYQARTGRPAPTVASQRGSIASTVAWAMTVAGVVALVESLVIRALADPTARQARDEHR